VKAAGRKKKRKGKATFCPESNPRPFGDAAPEEANQKKRGKRKGGEGGSKRGKGGGKKEESTRSRRSLPSLGRGNSYHSHIDNSRGRRKKGKKRGGKGIPSRRFAGNFFHSTDATGLECAVPADLVGLKKEEEREKRRGGGRGRSSPSASTTRPSSAPGTLNGEGNMIYFDDRNRKEKKEKRGRRGGEGPVSSNAPCS